MAGDAMLFDRELSWIAFNGRVLQEAADPRVPLYERLKFLAIYSSNLDEYFRVRVAGLRSLMVLGRKDRDELGIDAPRLLARIYEAVDGQQQEFGRLFAACVDELKTKGVCLLREDEVSEPRLLYLHGYFREQVQPLLQPVMLKRKGKDTFLHNRALYLIADLRPLEPGKKPQLGRVTIPSDVLPRFVALPEESGMAGYMLLDDVVRMHLHLVFQDYEVRNVSAIKLNRDADLGIEDEFSGDLVKKIRAALKQRETGAPARFLYDPAMPARVLKRVRMFYGLAKEDLFPGGRYHNFHDLLLLPNPLGPESRDEALPPLRYLPLEDATSMFVAVAARDHLMHFPYQRFDPVVRFLEEAAADASVESIGITLYRIASFSRIAEALIAAALAGKKVRVFMEIKARFDEEANIFWSERLKDAGAQVLYSIPGLKVHAKLYLITRREDGKKRRYAYLGTGNFNEKTAGLYCDHGYFTADAALTREVEAVLDVLSKSRVGHEFSHLAVAQFNLRSELNRLIDREIEHARAGRPAHILMKMNSLEDPKIIRRLGRASRAGVEIRLLVRGICCLVPGIKGRTETIRVTSIIDRYLEHARAYVFHNNGEEEYYLASADMMRRNLNRRIEVMFPVRDRRLQRELREILDLQFADTVKARLINAAQDNPYVPHDDDPLRSQHVIWQLLANRAENINGTV